jgi:hypothetical protein
MRIGMLVAALGLAAWSTSASAYTVTVLPSGQLAPSAGYLVETFDGLTQTPYGDTTPTGTFTGFGDTFSGDGVVMNNHGGGSLGLYATPFGDGTNYMAVLGGKSETIAFGSPESVFGLYWGSVDGYNSLTFYNGSTNLLTITGAQTGPLIASGGQGDYSSNGYVLISGLPSFDKVVISSGSNSFEFDNVAVAAVPEASTWAMMGLGFAGLGLAGFGAKRKREARALA